MLDEERLQELWDQDERLTLYGAISPLMRGLGDITEPHRERIGEQLELIVGDLAISRFEDELASEWAKCMDRQERAFRVITAFHRCIQAAAKSAGSDIVLVDLGPNLGAINRAALVASQYMVVPVAPDLFSLQGLKNLGPTVRQWREEWQERLPKSPIPALELPRQVMQPAGYVVLQHSVRKGPSEDRHCLGLLKRYGSLMPMAQEARKPIFHLKPADGALGAHAAAARDARADFKRVAERIAQSTWLPKPPR